MTREIAAALVLFGGTGLVALAGFRLALWSAHVDLLPVVSSDRVRWWRGHAVAAAVLSGCLLAIGMAGLALCA